MRRTSTVRTWCTSPAILVVALSLSACYSNLSLRPELPDGPLVNALPMTVGVAYDEAFLSREHDHVVENAPLTFWRAPVGAGSAVLLDACFEGMFEQVTRVEDWAPGDPPPPGLDAVIVPSIEEFDFREIKLKTNSWIEYQATVAYRMTIFTRAGRPTVSTFVRGDGSALGLGLWDSGIAGSAVTEAMRAATARMIIEFPDHSGLRSCLARRGERVSIRHLMFGAPPDVSSSALAARNGIVVVPSPVPHENDGYRSISQDIAAGVEKRLKRAHRARLVDAEDFRDQLFPWCERTVIPSTDYGMRALLDIPIVRRRLEELNVAYLIQVRGSARDGTWEGALAGGAGAFGVGHREEEADATAVVWDVRAGRRFGTQAADSGESKLVGVVLPIPLVRSARTNAIDALADQLEEYFKGIDSNEIEVPGR